MATAKDLRELYTKNLPKYKKITFNDAFSLLGSSASILALIVFLFLDENSGSKIYPFFLVFIVVLLVSYSVKKAFSKEHRYAQTVFFTHHANHIVRDFFSILQTGKPVELKDTVEEILSTVANCFSIITGRLCRACIKDLGSDNVLRTTARDNRSKVFKNSPPEYDNLHTLKENTDFYNLWYAKDSCFRYFFCNDLPKKWRLRRYENTSFKIYGEPKIQNIMGISWTTNWKLPYKSTIVFPIRYLEEFIPPIEDGQKVPSQWKTWGFLCVDCQSKNVFDSRYAPELGLAFADLLYTLFSQVDIMDKLDNNDGREVIKFAEKQRRNNQ